MHAFALYGVAAFWWQSGKARDNSLLYFVEGASDEALAWGKKKKNQTVLKETSITRIDNVLRAVFLNSYSIKKKTLVIKIRKTEMQTGGNTAYVALLPHII